MERLGRHREGADFGEVLPEHVHRAAAEELPVALGDDEVAHRLVVGDGFLLQEHPAVRERSDQRPDGPHVTGAGGPDHDPRGWFDHALRHEDPA